MKKLFLVLVSLLLSLALVRSLFGNEPLRLSSLLELLSKLDIDFSNTVETISTVGDKLQLPRITHTSGSFLGDLWEGVKGFFNYFVDLFSSPIELFVNLVKDLLDFCKSVVRFYKYLLGI